MNLTERAELILGIAHRIKAEQEAWHCVDPLRLAWADAIVKGNAPPAPMTPARAHAVSEAA